MQKENLLERYLMKKTTKVLLLISVTGFLVGATTNVLWGIGMPIGAVFLGFFLISRVLEKEVTAFDEEQRMRLEIAAQFSAQNPTEPLPEHHLSASVHASASA